MSIDEKELVKWHLGQQPTNFDELAAKLDAEDNFDKMALARIRAALETRENLASNAQTLSDELQFYHTRLNGSKGPSSYAVVLASGGPATFATTLSGYPDSPPPRTTHTFSLPSARIVNPNRATPIISLGILGSVPVDTPLNRITLSGISPLEVAIEKAATPDLARDRIAIVPPPPTNHKPRHDNFQTVLISSIVTIGVCIAGYRWCTSKSRVVSVATFTRVPPSAISSSTLNISTPLLSSAIATRSSSPTYTHLHEVTLQNDGSPATIASAVRGYLYKDYTSFDPNYTYSLGTATRMAHELKREAPELLTTMQHDALVGDRFTFAINPVGDVVLISVKRNNRELLTNGVIVFTTSLR